MLLYGASGHAKVIISCLIANNLVVSAIFDDDLSKKELWQIPVIGHYEAAYNTKEEIIIGIGYNQIRQRIASIITHRFGTVIHPSAVVDASVEINEGTVVFQGAILQASAIVGKHVIVNTTAVIDHDCVIGDFAHIAPHATLCGNVQVGEGTLIGAGVVVAPNLIIGKNCMIAAGSVITRNIPDGAVVRGNPGRIIKFLS